MQNKEQDIETKYKTLVVLWAAMIVSQLLFVLVIFFTRPKLFQLDLGQPLLGDGDHGSTGAVVIGFAVAAITAVAFSFAFRRRLNERAVAEQSPANVQSGFIIALAFSEAASLFGLALAFAFDYQYFFLWIILGIAAIILHFPKRTEFHAASYQNPS